ncbi:macrolide-specific efflux system membrane fusion protein [Mitsuaria sp. BK045]|uniref:efflux RND transporter periplasmic adaptor subunit n=2 Tax=Roseateles TaxID=93681 RepID=UPI00160C0D12|nr:MULTISPECIES: efflux RND transporter periplasmic adaptor subunit [unclassified Roseateles]MBB3295202.1 macrolide-specific efflux system membrane fusion protein [Mitsuaria sp. BK041]MBB3364418.1 macrolide-specific efflux system membrane fusion protein [Mitsuaria sp. BK045]
MKQWMKPGRLVAVAAGVVVMALIVKAVWFSPPPPPQVTSAAVERGDLEVSVLATGTINAYKLVSVGARATGEVKRLAVALGDKVKEGQLIAEIDALTQQNALRDAQASLRSAEALLGARQATLVQAELAAKRQRELAAGDAGARADLEAAEATLNTARADVESQRAMVAQARINVDTAQLNLGYARVLAPMDGTVVAIVTEQGQTVNAAQTAPTIIKLARLDTMTIKARISEADVPRVKPGMPVHFSLLGEPDRRIQATLRAVEPGDTTLADSSATTSTSSSTSGTTNAIYYNGIFDVPNPDGTLRINMTAQATIVLAQAKAALTIPVAALGAREGSSGDRHKVRVLGADGRIEDRVVRVGLNNRVRAQVLDGLKEGERVVTAEAAPPGAASDGRRPPPRM